MEDKENQVNIGGDMLQQQKQVWQYPIKNSTQRINECKESSFNRLLRQASNDVRCADDEIVAVDHQAEEAAEMIAEWIREKADEQLANELAEAMQLEQEAQKRLDTIRGRDEAMRVAVEEKRRIQTLAQEKLRREKEDEETAKRIIEEEEQNWLKEKKALEEADEKFCLEFAQQVTPIKNPELHAMDITADGKTMNACIEHKAGLSPGDIKGVIRRSESLHLKNSIYSPASKDIQDKEEGISLLTNHFEDEAKVQACEKERLIQEKSDFLYCQRLAMVEERKAFSLKKRAQMKLMFEEAIDKSEAVIANLWEQADAEVEDTANAICFSILLPNVLDLSVSLSKDGLTLLLDAKRLIQDEVKVKPTRDNSRYIAEFQLEGPNYRMSKSDFNYEYSSESGLLHIFVEDVTLDGDCGSSDTKGSSASSKEREKKGLFKSLRNNFLRIFGASGKK